MKTDPIYAVIRQFVQAPIEDSGRTIVSAHRSEAEALVAKPADVESDKLGASHWHKVEAITPSSRLAKVLEQGKPAINGMGCHGVITADDEWLVIQNAAYFRREAEMWEGKNDDVAMWAKAAARGRGLTRGDWEYLEAAILLSKDVVAHG